MVAIHTGVRLACFAGLVHLVVIHLHLLLRLNLLLGQVDGEELVEDPVELDRSVTRGGVQQVGVV